MTRTLAVKVAEGLRNQGWSIHGYGGTWAGAMRPLEEYVQRRIERAVKAEREAIIDIVAMHGGSVEIEAAIRARGEKK